ncbi:MAG: HAMP domain-containing histidine kinase [Hungatella sp.]|nr:HAMP domain-containing histidine kinase [Hungatella sp.]
MRRPLSIKLKLTLWITGFMTLTALACLGVIMVLRGRVARYEAFHTLNLTLRANIPELSMDSGRLVISQDFTFYANDVYLLIYNKKGALLAGQGPPAFSVETPLESGIAKSVSGEDEGFFILDFWIPSGWEDGVWLRGVMKSPDNRRVFGNIFTVFFIAAPLFLLCASGGGYLIARRALAPIVGIGEAAGSISGGQDLTRRICLPSASREVSELANAFDCMFERLEQSFEAEKRFTSDASHELRTPVSVILAQCDYVKKHGDTLEEYEEAVEVIGRQARRMSLLIERLLDMARLDLGTQKMKTEAVDLSRMASVLCQELDTGDRGISITSEIQDGVFIQGDPFLISRAVSNLMENARKYGKEGGQIRVKVSVCEGEGRKPSGAGGRKGSGAVAVLQVEDDGIGIASEDLDKIWQRFYQAEESRQSGLGLGLAMVRQIVGLHRGTVRAESVRGQGSCFTLMLPVDRCGILNNK